MGDLNWTKKTFKLNTVRVVFTMNRSSGNG